MSANLEAGMQGGVNGAMMGGQIGGVYGAVIGGIAGLVLGLTTKDETLAALKKYNNEVVKNYATDLFDLRRVQNVTNIQYAQAIQSYQDQALVQKATYNASYGAADIIGSSSEALAQVLDFQTQQAVGITLYSQEVSTDNMLTSIDRAANSAANSLQRTKQQAYTNNTANMVKSGLDLYSQYQGKGAGTTSTQGTSSGGLGGLWDSGSSFGSFGGSSGGGGGGGGAISA